MATKKITLNELRSLVKQIINENTQTNLTHDAIIIGGRISNQVVTLIEENFTDEIIEKLWSNKKTNDGASIFFGFYEKVFESIMSKIYEKYSDSFHPYPGSASDEI